MSDFNLRMNFILTDSQKKIAILVTGLAVFVVLGWFLAIQPAVARIEALRRVQANNAERSQLASEILQLREEREQYIRIFGNPDDRHILLAQVTGLAQEKRVEIDTITPALSQGQEMNELVFDFRGRAPFFELMEFLKSLETFEPRIFVRKLDIQIGGQRRFVADRKIPEISMTLVCDLNPPATGSSSGKTARALT